MTEPRPPIDPDADMEGRLRQAFEAVTAPVAPEAVVERVARLAETPRPRWAIRPWLVIAALAVVVSVALVGGVLSLGSTPRPSVLGTPAPASIAMPSSVATASSPVTDLPSPSATTTIRVGQWSASCRGVPPDICEGVASLALNNLGRGNRPTAPLVVQDRPICPPVPVWADPTHCWQVYVLVYPPGNVVTGVFSGTICMVVAKRSTDGEYAQVAGDVPGKATLPGASAGCP